MMRPRPKGGTDVSEVLAVAFDDRNAAADVLDKLRSLGAAHLVELEDACVAQRGVDGRLQLSQAIGHRLPLHGRFWHDLVHHLLHHGRHREADCGTPDCRLDRRFCCQTADALRPGTSALFVLVRETSPDALIESLERHKGRVLRSTLPEREEEAVERAVGMRPPRAPSAAELQAMIAEEEDELAHEVLHKRATAEERRRREIARLRRSALAPDDIGAVLQRCTDAARAGQASVLAYRFPSEVCLDGGRAINNGEPGWPATLTGQPRALYEYYQNVLRPAGYHIRAAILNYPGGVPGDAGLFLRWAS
jgi:uncharacterized membrane protein